MDGQAVGVGLVPTTDLKVAAGVEGETVDMDAAGRLRNSTGPGGAPEGITSKIFLHSL